MAVTPEEAQVSETVPTTMDAKATADKASTVEEQDEDDDDDEEEEEWDEDAAWVWEASARAERNGPSGQAATSASERQEARMADLNRLRARVNFDALQSNMSHIAGNSLCSAEKKAGESRSQGLTRDTRATVEQCLDPRTMLVLSKLLKRHVFDEIHGCISTGKEANVYYATGPNIERAVKVYKTSILVFKDRARYVDGDHRMNRQGYCKNPRKMVAQWAEKEMRNLRRLHAAGVRCPNVIEVRQNVLVMDFIGKDGNAAPRLHNVDGLGPEDWLAVYRDCIRLMRLIMQECKLVHGDLSEYNMLLDQGELVIIDVSQSVERDHPQALDFLKRDCVNVNNFFGKRIERDTVPAKRLFEFVVAPTVNVGDQVFEPGMDEQALDAFLNADVCKQEQDDEEIWVNTWIPSNLSQFTDRAELEREIEKHKRGDEVLYARLLVEPCRGKHLTDEQCLPQPELAESAEFTNPPEADGEDKSEESQDGSEGEPVFDGHKPEGMSKQEWKAKVKEQNREKRKEKVPKHVKKKFHRDAVNARK